MTTPRSRFTYVLMHGTKPIFVLARAIPPATSGTSKSTLEIQMTVFLETNIVSEKRTTGDLKFKFEWSEDCNSRPYYLVVVKLKRKEITTFRVFCDVDCEVVENYSR